MQPNLLIENLQLKLRVLELQGQLMQVEYTSIKQELDNAMKENDEQGKD